MSGASFQRTSVGKDRQTATPEDWYDSDRDGIFFDELGKMRQEGEWVVQGTRVKRRGILLGVLLVLLVAVYIVVLVMVILIQHKTSHPFNITLDTPCTVKGNAATDAQKSTFITDGSPNLLSNDKQLLDVAMGLLIAGTIITSIAGIVPLLPLGRYSIQDRRSVVSVGWKILIILFGGIATFASQFCVSWAGAGYSKSFDASVVCNGTNVFTVGLHESTTADVKRYAVVASVMMSIATAILVSVLVILQDGSISLMYDVLHWKSKPILNQNGDACAPLKSIYDKHVMAYGKNDKNTRTVKFGGKERQEYVISQLDQSPGVVKAARKEIIAKTPQGDDNSVVIAKLARILDGFNSIITVQMLQGDREMIERSRDGLLAIIEFMKPQSASETAGAQLNRITAAAGSLLLKNPWYSAA